MVPFGSNKQGQNGWELQAKWREIRWITMGDYSPEKAGVGGSIPSLATIIPNDLASFVTNPSGQHLVSN